MEKFHQFTAATNENEHVAVLDAAANTLMYHTAKRIDAPCACRFCRGKDNTALYHSDRTWQPLYWLIKREVLSSIPKLKWARTPLGNNKVIPQTEETATTGNSLMLMGAKVDSEPSGARSREVLNLRFQ